MERPATISTGPRNPATRAPLPVVTGITGTNYTDTNLNSGTTYYYLVAGVNASGVSGFSPEAHATTPGVNPDPAQYHFETDPQRWYGGGSHDFRSSEFNRAALCRQSVAGRELQRRGGGHTRR